MVLRLLLCRAAHASQQLHDQLGALCVCTQIVTNALTFNTDPLHPVRLQALRLEAFWERHYPDLVAKWERCNDMVGSGLWFNIRAHLREASYLDQQPDH